MSQFGYIMNNRCRMSQLGYINDRCRMSQFGYIMNNRCRMSQLGYINDRCRMSQFGYIMNNRCRMSQLGYINDRCRMSQFGYINDRCRMSQLDYINDRCRMSLFGYIMNNRCRMSQLGIYKWQMQDVPAWLYKWQVQDVSAWLYYEQQVQDVSVWLYKRQVQDVSAWLWAAASQHTPNKVLHGPARSRCTCLPDEPHRHRGNRALHPVDEQHHAVDQASSPVWYLWGEWGLVFITPVMLISVRWVRACFHYTSHADICEVSEGLFLLQ